ncbi:hypothetical protein Q4596_06620 [Pseudoalteromonas carrageenovora]|uniref:hypothetical protein n=1 Tax=Pseudoalteromonas carrageenovora TaxID=227 RepID=UPI0026E408BC|nr:hypothetical protein [Pseudoalteromonas carrageenovora]MDO6835290.1 hypothetical protein [Pseudoalteromonas carrageenovora]
MKSKILSSERIIIEYKLKGIAILSFIIFLFLNNTLPESYSDWWDKFVMQGIPETVQFIIPSIVFSTLISVYFYNSDPVFKKSGGVNRWLKTLFPSNLLINKFSLDEHQANSLWFKYFNQWQHKEHPNHSFLKKSHVSSYNARLVYFLIFTFTLLSVISLSLYLISLLDITNSRFLMMSIILISLAGTLKYLHRPAKIDEDGNVIGESTGVWRSVEASFCESKSRFDREVISKCKTIEEAEELVENMSERWTK